MTNKIPKPAYQVLLGFLMLAFTIVACNSKKEGNKKEPPPDTVTVMPADTLPPPPVDTVKKKPVKDPS